MEKGSMVGLGLCVVGVFLSATLHGINIAFLFMEFGSIIIVVFGHLGATIASYPWEATQNVGKYVGKAMKGKEAHSASETILGLTWFDGHPRSGV
jgi:Flagellar motor component